MFNQIDIRQIRKSRGLTQSQLGVLCGMGKSQISRMEKGELGSPETIGRLLDAMGYVLVVEAMPKKRVNAKGKELVLDQLAAYKRNNAKKYGIESLGLFGSFARGEQKASSDVDIILSLSKPSLYKLAEIQSDLECLFKREVDVISANSRMTAEFKEQLKKDTIYV